MACVVKKFKGHLILLLTVAIVSLMLPIAIGVSLSDISGHWAEEQINVWLEKGLIKGYPDGTFKPDNIITRVEFMSLANSAFSFRGSVEIDYTDVPAEGWAHDVIAKAVAAGYIKGFDDGTMRPNDPITRGEVAVIIARVRKLEPNIDEIQRFNDFYAIPTWCRGEVGAVAAANIMKGYPDGTFGANNHIRRCEAVVALDGALRRDTVYDVSGVYGPEEGLETINNDVVIEAEDITLQNTVIEGNLTISKLVGNGNVTLKKVMVKGDTYIYGGGENSVYFIDTTTGKTYVLKDDGPVRIVVSGTSGIRELAAQSGVKLEEVDLTGKGIEGIVVDKKVDGNIDINLTGVKVESLEVQSEGVTVNADKATSVENLQVKADDVKVETQRGTTIGTLVADAKVEVTGAGKIDKAVVNVSGVKFETKPTNTEVAPNVEKPTQPAEPSPGGGGGGSSRVSVSAISVEGVAKVGETLIAKVTPEKATVNYQWMRADAEDGTYVAIDGATNDTYTLTNEDVGKWIKVEVRGTGNYTGTKEKVVGPVEEVEEPEVLEATWNDTGKVGTNTIDETAYVFQGFELLDSETNAQIALVASNIAKMTVLDPGAEEAKELEVGDDSDPLLWFNVRKAGGDYKYTVETKDGDVYEATLNWTAPVTATAEKTGEPAENEERKAIYQLYTVAVDVDPEDSKVYQIKPNGEISELAILTDSDNHLNIWFKVKDTANDDWKQLEGEHTFLIKKGDAWSEAVIEYKEPTQSEYGFELTGTDQEFIAGDLLEGTVIEGENGVDTTDLTPVGVTLKATTVNELGYANVKVLAPAVTGVEEGTLQFWAYSADDGKWFNAAVTGWGSGFPIAADYDVTTPIYVFADTAGTYTVTFKLVDLDNESAVIAEKTETITVVAALPAQSTYKLTHTGLADSYTAGDLIEETEQAAINTAVEAAIEGLEPIKVTLATDVLGQTGYDAVRIAPVGAEGNIQLWAKDTKGNWYDINKVGWGPLEGFALPAEYNVTTDIYVLSDAAGDYTLNIKLVDVEDSNKVIAEASGLVKVVGAEERAMIVSPATGETIEENATITVTAEGADDLRIMLWVKALDSVQGAKDAYYDDERVFSARLSTIARATEGKGIVTMVDGNFVITINQAFIDILEAGTRYSEGEATQGKYTWSAGDATTWLITPETEGVLWEEYATWDGEKVDDTLFVYNLGTAEPEPEAAVEPTTGVSPSTDEPVEGVQEFTFGFKSVTGNLQEMELDIYLGENTGENRNYANHLGINLPAGSDAVASWVEQVVARYGDLDSKFHGLLAAAGYVVDSETNAATLKENIFYTAGDDGTGTWTIKLDTAVLEEEAIEFLVAVRDDQGAQWGNNNYVAYPDDVKAFLYNVTLPEEPKEYHTYKFNIEDKADVYIIREGLVDPSNDDFKDMTPVKLSIVVDEEKDKAYEGKVRVAPVNEENLQLWAYSAESKKWFDINQVGWGPEEGFQIDPELVTEVYVIATEAFNANVTLKLVDVTGDYGAEDDIIISQDVEVKAVVGPVSITKGESTTYYETIQAAIDDATENDQIEVAAGTFGEALSIGKSLTILGVNADNDATTTSFLDAGSTVTGGIEITAGDVTIKGLTIETKGILASNITGLTVVNNRIEEIGEAMEGSPAGSIIGLDVKTEATGPIEINQNRFSDIGQTDGTGTAIRMVKAKDSITITDNIIEDVSKNGINLYSNCLANANAKLTITGNEIKNWDFDKDSNAIGGRAIRIDFAGTHELATAEITGNKLTPPTYEAGKTPVDSEYVKLTSVGIEVDLTNNYWGSATPNFEAILSVAGEEASDCAYMPYYTDEDMDTPSEQESQAQMLIANFAEEEIVEFDITPLEDAIQEAIAAKEGIAVSEDGLDVPAGAYWVTQADIEALDAAIATAEAAKGAVETQQDVAEAVEELEAAVSTFNDAKQEAIDDEDLEGTEDPVNDQEAVEDELNDDEQVDTEEDTDDGPEGEAEPVDEENAA